MEGKTCLTGPELVAMFLKLHGLLKCQGKVDEARGLVGILGQTLTALVATKNFSSWKLIQVCCSIPEIIIIILYVMICFIRCWSSTYLCSKKAVDSKRKFFLTWWPLFLALVCSLFTLLHRPIPCNPMLRCPSVSNELNTVVKHN